MFVEVKTFDAEPDGPQHELLFYHHQLLRTRNQFRSFGSEKLRRPGMAESVNVWHFGVYVLRLLGESPDDSSFYRWGRFRSDGSLSYVKRRFKTLIPLLRFDLRPDTLESLELRDHHAETEWSVVEKSPLGFEYNRTVVKRS